MNQIMPTNNVNFKIKPCCFQVKSLFLILISYKNKHNVYIVICFSYNSNNDDDTF